MDPEDIDDDPDMPDEEDIFLEEMGLGPDGTPMVLGDEAWDGSPWDPDEPAGVF